MYPSIGILRKQEADHVLRRSQSEIPIGSEPGKDITKLEDLVPFLGQVIKYTSDGGVTWFYAKIQKNPVRKMYPWGWGLGMDHEVLPFDGVHVSYPITDKDFSEGVIVRVATKEEIEKKKIVISYE